MNEDLAEAIALGHDLGHTPFGHAGERVLNDIFIDEGGFKHNEQSLRVVELLERNGKGLNLSHEVADGIERHTGTIHPETPEGRIIRFADRIAYINHDVDDAIRAGILREIDIPPEITCALGRSHSERINTLILDIVTESEKSNEIAMSSEIAFAYDSFYSFMFKNVYLNMKAKGEESKVEGIIKGLFDYYSANPDEMSEEYRHISMRDGIRRAVSDYVSGMTDKYAIYKYETLYIPGSWQLR